jgi:hypothetical protein
MRRNTARQAERLCSRRQTRGCGWKTCFSSLDRRHLAHRHQLSEVLKTARLSYFNALVHPLQVEKEYPANMLRAKLRKPGR